MPTVTSPPPENKARIATVAPEAKPKFPGPNPAAKPAPVRHQALVGLGEDDVTRLLGEPRDVRNDPPAMVWRYGVDGCAMELFFYLDLKSQDFRALAYNFESGTASDELKDACLGKIQEANRDRGH